MRLEYCELPTHLDFKMGVRFADWDRKAVNGNSIGMFIWVSSNKGRPNLCELLLRDGDHCIARLSQFHQTDSVLAELCPDNVNSSVFVHICINRLILRQEGKISILVADETGKRHHLGTVEFSENTFTGEEKPTIELGPRPILISSLGRSGSTILANSIGLHPEVSVIGGYPFEYRLFSYFLHATYITTSPSNHEFSMGADSFEKVNVFNIGFNPFNNRDFDRLLENDSLREFYETKFTKETAAFFMEQARAAIENGTSSKKTAVAFVEKAAGTNLSNLAANLFPNLKEIVLIRDFWDMALSMIAFDEKRGTTSFFTEEADDWLIARAFQHCNLTIRSRMKGMISVKYEDLIKNPKSCLIKLAGKLGLSQHPECIAAMLFALKDTTYSNRHKTNPQKKLSFRKLFSPEAVKAVDILISKCKNQRSNKAFQLSTWHGDNYAPTSVIFEKMEDQVKTNPNEASWREAFSWAADLEITISQQKSVKKKQQIEKLYHQSLLNSKNKSREIASLSDALSNAELRSSRAEVYAKSLETERIRLHEYIKYRDTKFAETNSQHHKELEQLQIQYASQIAAHSERASLAEIYCSSLRAELEKQIKIASLEKSKFEDDIAELRSKLTQLEAINQIHIKNECGFKSILLAAEEEIQKHSKRANLADEYAKSLESERAKLNVALTNEYNLRHKDRETHATNFNHTINKFPSLEEESQLSELDFDPLTVVDSIQKTNTTHLKLPEVIDQSLLNSRFQGEIMNQAEVEKLVASHKHWHHKFEIFPNVVTPGSYNPKFLLEKLGLPENLSGKKVLDIGACDGYYSAELYLRGAIVTALDYRPKTASGFAIMEQVKGVKIPHVVSSVYDINSDLGEFDIVLFLGVIYHLPDLLSALWKIRKVCKGTLFVESYVEDFGGGPPMARYYEASTLYGDATNFWAPNLACMESILRDCGFTIKRTHTWGDRAMVEAEANGTDTKMKMAYSTFISTNE